MLSPFWPVCKPEWFDLLTIMKWYFCLTNCLQIALCSLYLLFVLHLLLWLLPLMNLLCYCMICSDLATTFFSKKYNLPTEEIARLGLIFFLLGSLVIQHTEMDFLWQQLYPSNNISLCLGIQPWYDGAMALATCIQIKKPARLISKTAKHWFDWTRRCPTQKNAQFTLHTTETKPYS